MRAEVAVLTSEEPRRRRWRPWVETGHVAGWTAIISVGLAAVILALFGMREIYDLPGLDWAALADVGQTYEVVAALLSVPTFAGVIFSLIAQRREIHTSQVQTALQTQIELARIAIDHPETIEADGTISPGYPVTQARQYVLVNLWMSQWRSMHSVGRLTDEELRVLLARIFGRAQAREWWADARHSYRTGSRHGRRFFEIADEEFSRAAHFRPPGKPENSVGSPSRPAARVGVAGVACLAGMAVGAMSGWLIARNRPAARPPGGSRPT